MYKCLKCGREFGTAKSRQGHQIRCGLPPSRCGVCGKMFKDAPGVKLHMTVTHKLSRRNQVAMGNVMGLKEAMVNLINSVRQHVDCPQCDELKAQVAELESKLAKMKQEPRKEHFSLSKFLTSLQ